MKVLVCLLLICLLASPSIAFAVPKLSNFHRFTNNAINNKHHNSIQQNIKRSRLFMMRRGISNNSNRQFNNDNSLVQQLTRKTVTNALIFTNIAIFILQKIYPSLTNALMKVNPLVARGQTYRLVTACFAHGSITHLGFNMYSLYNIGPLAEAKFGKILFIN